MCTRRHMFKTFASMEMARRSFPWAQLYFMHASGRVVCAIISSSIYDHRSETGHAFNCREAHPPATLWERESHSRNLQATLRPDSCIKSLAKCGISLRSIVPLPIMQTNYPRHYFDKEKLESFTLPSRNFILEGSFWYCLKEFQPLGLATQWFFYK